MYFLNQPNGHIHKHTHIHTQTDTHTHTNTHIYIIYIYIHISMDPEKHLFKAQLLTILYIKEIEIYSI